jgi:hypothetical protein
MTDRDGDAAVDPPEDERPESRAEAAEIVRNDPALAKATEKSSEEAASPTESQ